MSLMSFFQCSSCTASTSNLLPARYPLVAGNEVLCHSYSPRSLKSGRHQGFQPERCLIYKTCSRNPVGALSVSIQKYPKVKICFNLLYSSCTVSSLPNNILELWWVKSPLETTYGLENKNRFPLHFLAWHEGTSCFGEWQVPDSGLVLVSSIIAPIVPK